MRPEQQGPVKLESCIDIVVERLIDSTNSSGIDARVADYKMCHVVVDTMYVPNIKSILLQ